MDNPTTSLFQGTDIKISNSQNNEEEEDIEDQKRRKEELQNLLTAALDDFNYEESTINSSTNSSVASFHEVQQNYRQASEPNEQLKVLYDVRVRELTSLKKEYEDFKLQAKKDNDALRNKLLLSEADMRQLQISLKNTEDLLVEKTGNINELKELLNSKDLQLQNYEKIIENYQIEVCTYQSTLNELQLKLADSSPFSIGAKKFNSEELQKAHQVQVIKLESLLNEQTKIANALEKEKISLQTDLHNLITQKVNDDTESNLAINSLSKTLDDAQQQCKNLVDVVEMLTTENRHLQGRLNSINNSTFVEGNVKEVLDYNVFLAHTEKLKKMVLDKSIHIDTLNAKLRNYENDVKELMEYRQLKNDIYKKEFNQCENKEHTKSLIVMQNDLQNYRRVLEDKNQQILALNSTNRDLQEKIEEMLLQTRNDIQNLSHKYSLPQLEQMTEELKNAEERIKELQDKLDKSEERRLSLVQKLQKNEKKIESELKKEVDSQNMIIKNIEKDKHNLENQIKSLQKELEISLSEIKNLKEYSDELIIENTKLKSELKQAEVQINNINTISNNESDSVKNEYEGLKKQLNQVMTHLEKNKTNKDSSKIIIDLGNDMEELSGTVKKNDSNIPLRNRIKQWKKQLDTIKIMFGSETDQGAQVQLKEMHTKLEKAESKIKVLKETVEELMSAKTLAQGEMCSYQFQVKDYESQLESVCKQIKYLEVEVKDLTDKLKEKEEVISVIQLQHDNIKSEYEKLKEELIYRENVLKTCEENKSELNQLLHKAHLQLEEANKEIMSLQGKLTDVKDKAVRRNLEKELKEAENNLEHSKIEEGIEENEYLKKILQAESLKCELKLREELQLEYLKKIRDIEKKYKKVCSNTNELYEEQLEKMKSQENRYREHLSKIVAECAQKISEFENEKENLVSELNYVQAEYSKLRQHAFSVEENFRELVNQIRMDSKKEIEQWKIWSKKFVSDSLAIETTNKKSRDSILVGMIKADSEIATIEKTYKDKVKKYLKNRK